MKANDLLYIYEIRALDGLAPELFEAPDLKRLLGDNLEGLHWEADFAFLFYLGSAGPPLEKFLKEHPNLALREVHELSYGQWQDGAGAEDIEVGGLIISPPERAKSPGRRLTIDPGLAFGFGGHPTTYYCLSFLSRILKPGLAETGENKAESALDLGAGTGILALAAAAMGVKKVLGVDYSHLAVEAARRNVELNGLGGSVEMRRGPAQAYAKEPGDILMANLHLSLQEELLELGAFDGRRWVIISGLLPSEGDRLMAGLAKRSLKMVDQVRTDRWISALLARL